MLYSFIILPKADVEYYDAINWYAQQQVNLPERFALEVAASIDKIMLNPESYPRFGNRYRQALMEKSPYFIVYSINHKKEIITIVSIFHTSRNPSKKFRK